MDLLNATDLFYPQKVYELVENNLRIGVKCLSIQKSFYTKGYLSLMKKIISKLDSLPNTGKIEVTKDGLLSKGKEKFICQNGHKNNSEKTFCSNENCGVDIKGLTLKDYHLIEHFKLKVDSLDFIMSNK